MFHALPLFLPFSWPLGACDAFLRSVGAQALRGGLAKNASPCVAERLGATTGATIGVTTGATIGVTTGATWLLATTDFQVVKCQV